MLRWLLCLGLLVSPLVAKEKESELEKAIGDIPAAGLILDAVEIDGIEITNFVFRSGKQYILAEPGAEVSCSFDYRLRASRVEDWKSHHYIWAVYPSGPNGCFLFSLGLRDREGSAHLSFKAPQDVGVYSFRVGQKAAFGCKRAVHLWKEAGDASAAPIVGIVIVE